MLAQVSRLPGNSSTKSIRHQPLVTNSPHSTNIISWTAYNLNKVPVDQTTMEFLRKNLSDHKKIPILLGSKFKIYNTNKKNGVLTYGESTDGRNEFFINCNSSPTIGREEFEFAFSLSSLSLHKQNSIALFH